MRKILILMFLLLTPSVCMAADYSANVWASWANVTTTVTTYTFPYNTRGIQIINGSTTTGICASFNNNTIDAGCTSTGVNKVFQISAGSRVDMYNTVQSSLNMKTMTGTASPVTVVVNY